MLSRRDFHATLVAGLANLSLPRLAFSATPTPSDLWLNRLTFGATPASRADFDRLGVSAWLQDQLSRPTIDAALQTRLTDARLRIVYDAGSDENANSWTATDDLRPLSALTTDPADLTRLVDWSKGMDFSERIRPASEVIAASLIRTVHAQAQLREVMAQFWHDHFNVNAMKSEFTAVYFASHDTLMRAHAFGNFRSLLGQVSRSPAMLYYLNNDESRASPANENYGRELLELHTLGAANYLNDRYADWQSVPKAANGVAQGYLDLDVYEVARAFTGWSVGDGRYVTEGVSAPLDGRFHYVEAWHDPYQKRILGVDFSPNGGPMADGDRVLDLLATHPGTARFICEKIARRLLMDSPEKGLIESLSTVFLAASDAPDQIAQVIRALVMHPAFAVTPPQKIRRPFELLTALYRATGAEVTGTETAFQWPLSRAGWHQHEYGPPTGHPDRIANWTGASTLNRIVDFALYAHDDWFGTVSVTLTDLADPGETMGTFLARWSDRFGAEPDDVLAALGIDPAQPAQDLNHDDRRSAAIAAIAMGVLTPQFLLR